MGKGRDDIPDSDEYDLAPTPPPSPPTPSSPKPVPASRPPLAYRAPRKDKPAPTDQEQVMNLYAPIWLLGGGMVVEVIAAFLTHKDVDMAVLALGIGMVFQTGLMLVALMIVAKLRGIELGPFWPAVLKLAAVCIAPGAIVALVSPLLWIFPLGGLVGVIAQFVLFFALLGALFNLDESDTWLFMGVNFLMTLGIYFLLKWLATK